MLAKFVSRRRLAALVLAVSAPIAHAGPTPDSAFTYQGQLNQMGSPVDGSVDFEVSLWDADTLGNQIGSTHTLMGVVVADGLFTIELNFGGDAFDANRWLEFSVDGGTLSPRQKVTASPYSLQTRGIFVDPMNQIGIGTTIPGGSLEVQSPSGIEPPQGQILIRSNAEDFVGVAFISFE